MSERFEQNKRPPDMDVVLPRNKEEAKNSFLINGENYFRERKFLLALAEYKKISCDDVEYWKAKVNEMLCEVRLKNYNSALLVFDHIKNNCDNPIILAQAYINRGDCMIGLSVRESDNCWEKMAYESYQEAHKTDPNSIATIFHFWFAENALCHYQNAEVLRSIIENHQEYSILNKEQVRYFLDNSERQTIKIFKERFIMDWKKLVLVGMCLLINATVVLANGVLNGGN